MPDDPEKTSQEPQEKAKPEPQEKAEEQKQEDEEVTQIPLPCTDGQERRYTAQQTMQLAVLGQHRLSELEKEKEKEEVKEEDITIDGKYDKLNREFQEFKEDSKRNKELNQFRTALSEAINSFDLFKDHPELKEDAQLTSATYMTQNQNLTHKQAVAKYVKKQQAFIKKLDEQHKKSSSANKKVFARITQGQKEGGGLPEIESTKPFGMESIRSGDSQRAVGDYLRSLGEE